MACTYLARVGHPTSNRNETDERGPAIVASQVLGRRYRKVGTAAPILCSDIEINAR